MVNKKQAAEVNYNEARSAIINSTSLNTSQKIRALHGEGMSRGEIAKVLGKRYQHVRNVLITPIKQG